MACSQGGVGSGDEARALQYRNTEAEETRRRVMAESAWPRTIQPTLREGGVVVNKDEIKDKWEKAKGYVKDKAGEATKNPDLEAEGEAQKVGGEAQEMVGRARRKAGETVEGVADKIKGKGH